MDSWRIIVITFSLIIGICHGYSIGNDDWNDLSGEHEQCEAAIKETILDDRAAVVDETPDRLHSTWLSQECEVKAGPEYIIRKYTFYENGTFLLLRHHYAEESCSVATHTVTARGSIRLLSASGSAFGAVDAKYQLDHVHILPLTRQVAHKFGHRVNATCTPQPKWRPFVAQVIYEQFSHRSTNHLWDHSSLNSFQRPIPSKKHHGIDCLNSLNIDFNELRLVRVQKKPLSSSAFSPVKTGQVKVELFFGSLPPNVQSRKSHRSTSLQPTSLIRSDMTTGCLVCSTIIRGTESSPPLLHELAALPALLGGHWISSNCESNEGGFWVKRQLRIYSGDTLWSGRNDYYSDPKCSNFLYAISSAGSYIQRAGRQKRHGLTEKDFPLNLLQDTNYEIYSDTEYFGNTKISPYNDKSNERTVHERKALAKWMTPELAKKLADTYGDKHNLRDELLPTVEDIQEADESVEETFTTLPRVRRSLDSTDEINKHILHNTQPSMAESFAAMLRGNQRQDATTKKPLNSMIPTGTTELDLHVAESLLIAGDISIAERCGAQISEDNEAKPLTSWPRNCVKHSIEAPSTIGLRARIGVNWSGQYTLSLGQRDDSLWEAPLRQCSRLPSYNPFLRYHLRQSLGYRYGLFTMSGVQTIYQPWTCIIIFLSCLCLFR